MPKHTYSLIITVLFFVVQFLACGDRGPTEIHYGQDQCDHCKMTIADKKFGSEMITAKGKVYKFDSIECLAAYDVTNKLATDDIHSMWVSDFIHPGTFINVDNATIIASERQKSPIGIGLLAVSSSEKATPIIQAVGGKVLDWEQVCALVAADWHL